jgi:transposase
MQPGAVPAEVARRWGIGTGLLYTWRRQLLAGELGEPPVPAPAFAQVTLAPPVEPEPAPPDLTTRSSDTVPAMAGRIEITLPGGAVERLRCPVIRAACAFFP